VLHPEGLREREHGVADIAMLLSVICLSIVTWAHLGAGGEMPSWKPYIGVAVAWWLSLAALTRHPSWSASIRCLTGGWMMVAPYLLGFPNIEPAHWAYLAAGLVLTILSVPALARRSTDRAPLAA
jgi:hypothetical protein